MGNSGIPSTSYVKTVLIFQFLFFVSLIINFDVFYIFLSKLRSCFRCSGMHVLINIEGQPISFGSWIFHFWQQSYGLPSTQHNLLPKPRFFFPKCKSSRLEFTSYNKLITFHNKLPVYMAMAIIYDAWEYASLESIVTWISVVGVGAILTNVLNIAVE